MKVIVAGGRDFNDYLKLQASMDLLLEVLSNENNVSPEDVEIISGAARGADALGARWARENGRTLHTFPAQWDIHGRSAGYIRNSQMAQEADAMITFWDGESRGTQHMIETMEKLDKLAFVVYY